MTCINKPRYHEIVDPSQQPYVLVCIKAAEDRIRLEIRDRASESALTTIEMTVAETTGLVQALANCVFVAPLPDLDYPATEDDGPVVLTRTPHVRGTPLGG